MQRTTSWAQRVKWLQPGEQLTGNLLKLAQLLLGAARHTKDDAPVAGVRSEPTDLTIWLSGYRPPVQVLSRTKGVGTLTRYLQA